VGSNLTFTYGVLDRAPVGSNLTFTYGVLDRAPVGSNLLSIRLLPPSILRWLSRSIPAFARYLHNCG
jgi:hypothetical protein